MASYVVLRYEPDGTRGALGIVGAATAHSALQEAGNRWIREPDQQFDVVLQSEARITAEEYLSLPDDDGVAYELVDGLIVSKKLVPGRARITGNISRSLSKRLPPDAGRVITATDPGIVASRIAQALSRFLAEQPALGEVFTRVGYILSRDPYLVKGPLVSFLRSARASRIDPWDFIPGAPDLAVLTVARDSPERLEFKVRQYLDAGTHTLWVVYPEFSLEVIRAGCEPALLGPEDNLEEPGLLPGFSARIRPLFEGLETQF